MFAHEDKDGLLPTSHVVMNGGRFFYGSVEIFVDPQCGSVSDYLVDCNDLWKTARLRFNKSDIRQKRAPIIGIPFSRALELAQSDPFKLHKSMFEIPEWTNYQGKAVIATLIAHTSKSKGLIEFQAWQLLDVSDETFYLHAILTDQLDAIVHLDGATMLHTNTQKNVIRNHARKIKGTDYQKHFRIDGKFELTHARCLIDRYFPVQPLNREFLDAIQ